MGFQAALVKGGVVGRTVGNPKGLTLTRRTAMRAWAKEHYKLKAHFDRKFPSVDSELSESEIAEVEAAFAKLSRKWGIWG